VIKLLPEQPKPDPQPDSRHFNHSQVSHLQDPPSSLQLEVELEEEDHGPATQPASHCMNGPADLSVNTLGSHLKNLRESDFRFELEPKTSKNTSTFEVDNKSSPNGGKFSKSMRNYNLLSDACDGEESSNNKNPPAGPRHLPPESGKRPKRISPQAPAAKEPRHRSSAVDGIKIEFRRDVLLIFTDSQNLDSVPIDQLKVSNIHDISKNVLDKLNLDTIDHQDYLFLESKLESALQFKRIAANSLESRKPPAERDAACKSDSKENSSLNESFTHSMEDQLTLKIHQLSSIYTKEYLEKVLKSSWREEGMHEMTLRHEAELTAISKLHTLQKQVLLDEMARRRNNVILIKRRMKHVKKDRRPPHEESSSRFEDFESHSIKSSVGPSFRGSTYDPMPDDLSKIHFQPHRDHGFCPREDQDLVDNPLLAADICLPAPGPEDRPKSASPDPLASRKQPEDASPAPAISKGLPPLLPNKPSSGCCSISPPPQPPAGGFSSNADLPVLKLKTLLVCSHFRDSSRVDSATQQTLTQRTCEDHSLNRSARAAPREEVFSLQTLSPLQRSGSFGFESLLESFQVPPTHQKLPAWTACPCTGSGSRETLEEVSLLQRGLQLLFPESEVCVSGVLDPPTLRLLEKFQESCGLQPLAKVTQEAWTALRSSRRSPRSRPPEGRKASAGHDPARKAESRSGQRAETKARRASLARHALLRTGGAPKPHVKKH